MCGQRLPAAIITLGPHHSISREVGWSICAIDNFGRTLRDINNLLEVMFNIKHVINFKIFSVQPPNLVEINNLSATKTAAPTPWRLNGCPLIIYVCSLETSDRQTWSPLKPLSLHDALKHHFISLKRSPNFPIIMVFRMNISMKLVYQYMIIFFVFSPASTHLHPLQVENYDSNSRLVVDEDDYSKFRLERVNPTCTLLRVYINDNVRNGRLPNYMSKWIDFTCGKFLQ